MTNQPDESDTEAGEKKAPLLIKMLSALTLNKQQPRGAWYIHTYTNLRFDVVCL